MDNMDKEYRAFWNGKMWEVMAIDYRLPEAVILTDGTMDYLNVPLAEVKLMRSTGKQDISGEMVYEGDFIESHQGTQILDVLMLVKYGTYQAYCPADDAYMDNVGFYVEAVGYPQMPLGPLEDYAKIIGNVCENADWLDKEVTPNEST